MKKYLSILFFVIFFLRVSDAQSQWAGLNELYFENSRLSRVDTFVGYSQLRAGGVWTPGLLEMYAVARLGADSRTNLDSSSNVYNDNFVFAGIGVDYLGLLPGVRLTLQMGGSFDLSEKIHRGGFDYRIGTQSYHEIAWNSGTLTSEVYSEALYFERYRNLLGSVQFRTIYHPFQWKLGKYSLDLGPLISWVGSLDSEGLDYNRFMELRVGPRLTLRGPITLALSPHYVWGGRWARPTDLMNYQDFRVLLTGFISL